MHETLLLWSALACYAAFALLAVPVRQRGRATTAQALSPGAVAALSLAVSLHGSSLATRWVQAGHGPFTSMHEILSSNLWSLSLVLLLCGWPVRDVRRVAPVAVPVMLVLGVWLLVTDARPGHLPPTYQTPLLYLHTLVGKLFLGLLLVACALGGVATLRQVPALGAWLHGLPTDRRLDLLAHRFAAYAFVFDTLMLIVGAVWAQDAWGRYWAWDPLETWAFVTWLALAATLHAHASQRPSPAAFGACLAGVFLLAFLTFFGVPFVSVSPHKGAV